MKASASAPRKRLPEDITTLSEPVLSEAQRAHFLDGIAKFNCEAYWDAHEAWEQTWQAMSEDAEIFIRGLVQLAAALHCLQTQRLECAARNFEKAYPKLAVAPAQFMGIDVEALRAFIRAYQASPNPSMRCQIQRVASSKT
ncbi:MAG: DUF309 domain-containing protein [Candidatus Thermochlorobacter sp.]